jgi:hypothetical protein
VKNTTTGKNLVVWLHKTINLSEAEDHRVAVSILRGEIIRVQMFLSTCR